MKLLEILQALDEGKILLDEYGYRHQMVAGRYGRDGLHLHSLSLLLERAGSVTIYEEPGNDWNWVLSQLALGRRVRRKNSTSDLSAVGSDTRVLARDTGATDWILA